MTTTMSDQRREFLEARQAGLGSSDIGPVLGLDPWRGPIDVYLEKTRPIEEQTQEQNVHILRGTLLEDVFAKMYVEQTGRNVRRTQTRVHPDFPWARANADRIILADGDRPTGVLELKAPTTHTFRKLVNEGLFPSQIAQIQWEMFVGQYTWGAFAFGNLETEPPLVTFDVEPDPAFIEAALPVLESFWIDNVEARVPPPQDVLPAVEVPVYEGELVAQGALETNLRSLFNVKTAIAEATEWKQGIEAEVKKALEEAEANVVTSALGKAVLVQTNPRRTFQPALLAKHRPLDRDRTERLLRSRADELGIDQADIEDFLERTALDLEPFYKVGEPSSYIRTYPAKETDDE